MVFKKIHLFILIVVSVILSAISFYLNVSDDILSYDEGDYYQAAKNGFYTNWMDTDDMPIKDFLQTGVEAIQGKKSISQLSDQLRNNENSMFLRHSHSPVALYPFFLIKLTGLDIPIEKQIRLTNLFWVWIWLTIVLILFAKFEQISNPLFFLLVISSSLSISFSYFNMHIPFALMSSLGFYCWYWYEKEPSVKWFKYLTIIFLSVSVVTVEYSLFLISSLILWFILEMWFSKDRKVLLIAGVKNFAIGIGVILVLWPASILKLNLFKSYAHQAYIALFRLSKLTISPFNSFWEMIFWKWNPSIFELIILVSVYLTAAFLLFKKFKQGSLFVSFILVTVIGYVQLNPNLTLRWYLFPVFALVFFYFLPILYNEYHNGSNLKIRIWAFTSVIIVIIISGWFPNNKENYYEAKEIKEKIAQLHYSAIILPRSLYPQLRHYLNKDAKNYHDDLFRDESFVRKLYENASDLILVVPITVEISSLNETIIKTKNYKILYFN